MLKTVKHWQFEASTQASTRGSSIHFPACLAPSTRPLRLAPLEPDLVLRFNLRSSECHGPVECTIILCDVTDFLICLVGLRETCVIPHFSSNPLSPLFLCLALYCLFPEFHSHK